MGPLKTNGSEIPSNEFDLPAFQSVILVQQQQYFSGRTICPAALLRSNEWSEFCLIGDIATDADSHLEEAIPLSVLLQRDRRHHEEGEVS